MKCPKARAKLAVAVAVGATALATITGCSDTSDDSQPAADSPTPTSSPSTASSTAATPKEQDDTGTVIDVRIDGNEITPSGDRVEVRVGEPVTFLIRANRPGGLHVHSEPEQSFDFGSGKSIFKVVIDRPGIVDVEEHEADRVVVQLEVRP